MGLKGGLVAEAVADFGAWRATDSSGDEDPKAAWSRARQTTSPQLWNLVKVKNEVKQEGILLMFLCAQGFSRTLQWLPAGSGAKTIPEAGGPMGTPVSKCPVLAPNHHHYCQQPPR